MLGVFSQIVFPDYDENAVIPNLAENRKKIPPNFWGVGSLFKSSCRMMRQAMVAGATIKQESLPL
jgi:hypothetical protein